MKKNTKMLLGAGAALGLGYLLFKKKGGGLMGLADNADAAKIIDDGFDSFYWTESGFRVDWNDVLLALVKFYTGTSKNVEGSALVAAYKDAVAAGMKRDGCGSSTDRCVDAAKLAYYAPFLAQALSSLGVLTGDTSSGGSSEPGAGSSSQPETTYACADGSIVSALSQCAENAGPGSTSSGGSKSSGSAPVGTKTKNSDGTTTTIVAEPDGKKAAVTTDAGGVVVKVEKLDDSMGASTWLLLGGLGVAAYFLLKTDDSRVTVVRAQAAGKAREYGSRAAGAASKKLAEYERRLARGSGVNGLRGRRRARR